MKVVWTVQASERLLEIETSIAEDAPKAAAQLVDRLSRVPMLSLTIRIAGAGFQRCLPAVFGNSSWAITKSSTAADHSWSRF